MAIVFPTSPTLNQEFTAGSKTWIWDGEKWISVSGGGGGGGGGGSVAYQDEAPSSPSVGTIWVESDETVDLFNTYTQSQIDTFLLTKADTSTTYTETETDGLLSLKVNSSVVTNTQGASYTLVISDAGKMIEMNVATSNNLTVPLNSSVGFPIGTMIDVLQTGLGQTTIVPVSGVTINARFGLKISGQWGSASLIKRGENTWVLTGSLVT